MNKLEKIVEEFAKHRQRDLDSYLLKYSRKESLEKVISQAALSRTHQNKKENHQKRLSQEVLEESEKKLQEIRQEISEARNFDDLYNLVSHTIRGISGIGKLAVYDTSLRIGAFLGLEPTKVYLHAGARQGAKNLNKSFADLEYLELSELPAPLQKLEAREIEDILCVYKDSLGEGEIKIDKAGCRICDG